MRQTALVLAAVTLGVAWFAPLHDVSGGPFAAHMTAHMAIVAIATPLVAIGLATSRFDPIMSFPWLSAAIPASLFELIVVSVWHAPALHHAAGHRADVFIAEQASFLAAGLWLWFAVLGGDREMRARRAGNSVIALLLTFAHMTLLGALLTLTPRPLYHQIGAGATLTPLADQQLGGTIMLVVGGLSYIGGGLWLSRDLLRKARTPVGQA